MTDARMRHVEAMVRQRLADYDRLRRELDAALELLSARILDQAWMQSRDALIASLGSVERRTSTRHLDNRTGQVPLGYTGLGIHSNNRIGHTVAVGVQRCDRLAGCLLEIINQYFV